MSKIEEIINEIEAYLDGCKPQAFSGSKKIVVEKDTIDEMLGELRMRTPEEIKRYQKIIASRDAIIADARQQADNLIEEARQQAAQMVQEHEITQQAYSQAQEVIDEATEHAQNIVDNATNEANMIRTSAMEYTDSALKNLQTIMSHTMEDSQRRFDSYMEEMQSHYEIVTANRNELSQTTVEDTKEQEGYNIDIPIADKEEVE